MDQVDQYRPDLFKSRDDMVLAFSSWLVGWKAN